VVEAYVQEKESDNCPRSEVDGNGRNLLGGILRGSISLTNTGTGDQEAGKGKPECAVGGESY
jgi:hypothetical protein